MVVATARAACQTRRAPVHDDAVDIGSSSATKTSTTTSREATTVTMRTVGRAVHVYRGCDLALRLRFLDGRRLF